MRASNGVQGTEQKEIATWGARHEKGSRRQEARDIRQETGRRKQWQGTKYR